MGPLALNANERYTYGEYKKWNDGKSWELIDGVPYSMTPAPSRKHQKIAGELFRQFANYLTDKPCEVYAAHFDVRLPEADEADDDVATVVQPDIAVICDQSKLDDAGCKGSPDLIVEVLSPATSRKDLKDKFLRYERAGVREYWLADPTAKTVMVFTIGADGRYGRPGIYAEEDTIRVGIFEDLTVDLPAVFR
ncbi:Uma2 family endonuclease [Geotalea uraniireducens]|uniref:Putative restriction endonuclease domain-containing protein n=1 Tax=Geotalea uraniireducens (strain Rf4) TaxID=351605 RepID=A5G6X1_GEOUR|nr:Uma2 family endonuclease [Geotalea uraniireducens]ABQ27539.1 protein of unknown function DUF820 [Geotalea uraniireducens Rf4]